MANKRDLEIAIDFSGPYLNCCLREINSKKIILTINKLMQRREAALICPILEKELKSLEIQWSDIQRFTVGSGPGSFTGMRIAASFISGITFNDSVVLTRLVPSAYAIASNLKLTKNDKVAVLFDGRNKEIILFEVECQNDNSQLTKNREAILNKEQCIEYFKANKFDKFVAMSYDKNALDLILPDNILNYLELVDEIKAEYLLEDNLGEFDNDLTNLHYIRPSVISK